MKSFRLHLLPLLLAALVLGAAGLVAGQVAGQDRPAAGQAFVLVVDDAIGPATRDYIVRGIERAEDEGAGLVVIKLNTPGGLDASMRDIIRKFLASEVPVATWVAPAGSRAASAGTYMLYASHIAAMAPATNLGAATPVQIGGGGADDQQQPATPLERAREVLESQREQSGNQNDDQSDDQSDEPNDDQNGNLEDSETEAGQPEDPAEQKSAPAPPVDATSRKMINDAVAYIKGLAERHGRNAEWAERAVREAVSLTASEALEIKVIDVIASSLPELLQAIDGRVVQMDGGELELATAGLEIVEIEPDWRTRFLAIITNPTLAYILLMVGVYGLILEGYNPGALVPGVIGGICLLLALYAFQILPVNYAGLALMALGLALIAVELFVPSFGILGIGGIIAMVFGSIILFDNEVPGFDMSTGVVIGMALFSALVFAVIVYLAARTLKKPRPPSDQMLVGELAEAISDFDPDAGGQGRVHLMGEDWRARSGKRISRGDPVRVTGMLDEGLMLEVEPASEQA